MKNEKKKQKLIKRENIDSIDWALITGILKRQEENFLADDFLVRKK